MHAHDEQTCNRKLRNDRMLRQMAPNAPRMPSGIVHNRLGRCAFFSFSRAIHSYRLQTGEAER